MPESILSIERLSIRYRSAGTQVSAVHDFSLALRAGEIAALVGESGCGKTSVAMAVLGLLDPRAASTEGRILFTGEDLLSMPPARLRRIRGRDIAMIFQDPMSSLNPYHTIGRQVAEPLRAHRLCRKGAARQRAGQLLADIGFPAPHDALRRFPHQFSGGMCQRAMIAGALACGPRVLLADEPTTALDVITQAQVLAQLAGACRAAGMALLLITHDLGLVASLCDTVVIMRAGAMVESQSVRALFQRPEKAYTRGLLAAVPRLDGPRPERLPTAAAGRALIPAARPSGTAPAAEEAANARALLLRAENIRVTFSAATRGRGSKSPTHAVRGVDLELFSGEIVGLVGESGCGKSTLVRALLGLLPQARGRITFRGGALSPALSRAGRQAFHRQVQLVFQDPYGSLNSRMTIGQSIAEPLRNFRLCATRAERRARVAELLTSVQLDPDWMHRYPHECSGGQRQRVGIARALATQPRLLYCDEPVSALDVSVQAEILNLLKALRARFQLTLLFISHDMAVVRFMADRIAVMHAGRIVEWLDPENLAAAREAYTRRLIAAVPNPAPPPV